MAVHIEKTSIPEVLVITPDRFTDERGFFEETYSRDALAVHGLHVEFVQDNQSLSVHKHTVRGLHYQAPPFAQDKLVRVLSGAVLDVAVDMRHGSSTFGEHVAVTLSADNGRQLFVPAGFAHGFCTLEDHSVVAYKVSAPYSQKHDGGIFWADPALAIDWPVGEGEAVLSGKDQALPGFAEVEHIFDYTQ